MFKNLILTCPFPQLKNLGSRYLDKKIMNLNPVMLPNITVMAVYKGYKKIPISSIKFNDKIISWACQENSKNRFKSNECLWTFQCSEIFSQKFINSFKENKKKYQSIVLKQFEKLSGYQVKKVVFQNIHGWKYAYCMKNSKIESLWLKKINLGICADWFNGPKAEDSWLSANSLYKQIKKNPLKN